MNEGSVVKYVEKIAAVSNRPRRDADDIKSLRHGIAALQMTNARLLISSGDLAADCSISRAAAYRILQTLHDEGYLLRSGNGNRVRYQLSQRVRELAYGYDGGARVVDVAIPMMIDWTRNHGWPLAIATANGDRCITRFTTDPAAARVLIRYRPGAEMSFAMSASAMVSLAYQPAEIQASAIRTLPSMPLPPYAKPLTAPEIATQLKRVRQDGFAVFHPLGLREASIAMPIVVSGQACCTIAMRYMLVADGGKSGHAQRLRLLRGLADAIAAQVETNMIR